MHPDKKIGLAMGILLIGVTGAFFFRNKGPQSEPRLQDPQSLDDQISQQQGPKPHVDLERPEPIDDDDSPTISRTWSPLTGSGQTGSPTTASRSGHDVQEPNLPEVRTITPDQLAKSNTPPDPIPATSRRRENDPIPLSRGNRGWEVVTSDTPAGPTRDVATAQPASSMRRHVVRRGETLSGLAARYLGSSARFEEIYRANRDVLRHPNDLRVGMTIRIPSRSLNQTGATQVKAGKSDGVKSSAKRNKSHRRLRTRSVSRETKSGNAGTAKSRTSPHKKHRSWFIPVRRTPFFRRPPSRRTSSKKTKRKRLSQVPPTDVPAPSKK